MGENSYGMRMGIFVGIFIIITYIALSYLKNTKTRLEKRNEIEQPQTVQEPVLLYQIGPCKYYCLYERFDQCHVVVCYCPEGSDCSVAVDWK